MSSPADLLNSQTDFLAQWLPSSTRAGVILNPSPDLAGSLRPISATGSTPLQPDDSFSSDFCPLPATADSSCLDVDGCGRSPGEVPAGNDSLDDDLDPEPERSSDEQFSERAPKVQDDLTMKLDQLKKWQQDMHVQLKPNQLEELLCFQEEDHRLLGIGNGSQICTGGVCNSREDEEQSANPNPIPEYNNTLTQPEGVVRSEGNSKNQDEALNDRPIRPGVGGQKRTFEELLEEQLRLEEQRLKFTQQPQKPEAVQTPPKRPFLKRGQGLFRFTNNRNTPTQKAGVKKDHSLQRQGRAISRSKSAPAFNPKGSSSSVQRKTATLNKDNRVRGLCSSPQDIRAESKAARTKVLGFYQRQNTAPASIQTQPEAGQSKHHLSLVKEQSERNVGVSVQVLRTCSPNIQQNPVTKQVLERGTSDSDAAKEQSSGSTGELSEVRTDSGKGGGVPLDSLEVSFQEKLQHWEFDRQLESMELGEFELLEQAADEMSFSSNSSFVMKVLQLDQQKRQVASGNYGRRLSSTPIKVSFRGVPQDFSVVQHNRACEHLSVESGVSVVKIRGDTLKNKVSSEDEDGQSREEEGRREISDISECGSEFGDEELVVKSSACFPATSDPPYDKWSYQDEDSFRDSASDVAQEDGESDGVPSHDDSFTLIEDRDTQQGRVVFDDDDTWNDLDDTVVCKTKDCREFHPVSSPTVSETSPPEKILLRKVALSKVVELDKNLEPDLPPASQLMTRLFPSLKPQAQNAPVLPPASESNKSNNETDQQVQSRQLRERLAELEIEIERFKKENSALAKLRQENERKQADLRKDQLAFEQKKTEELAKFEEYKKEENRKLQKERKLFEKHSSAARAIPDKKEREEIQLLKQQLSSLQEELERKESRWTSTVSRLRQQNDSLNQEISSLRDEIRMLETLRVSALKKNSVSAAKDVGTKNVHRISENNLSSVTKGTTFPSHLDSTRSSCSPLLTGATAATGKDSSEAAAGIKSLRSSSSSHSSSSSLSVRTMEKPETPNKNQETPSKQEPSQNCSPVRGVVKSENTKIDPVPKQPESCEFQEPQTPREVVTQLDGKVEKVLANGGRLIVFPNGTRKEISSDGLSAKITFFNGDIKEITVDQRVIYYYSEVQTTHITYPDGMEVLHFPNNQIEKHFPDGRQEITFPNQTVKNLFPDGRAISVLTDGTVIQVDPDGTKHIHFNTGQKEIHTPDYKRREYPDGSVKIVYADGRQETHYQTGRIRVKDKDGNVILDNRAKKH